MLTTLSVITEQKIQVDRAEEFGSVFPNNNKRKQSKKEHNKILHQNFVVIDLFILISQDIIS